MRPLTALSDIIDRQRGYLFPWASVFYGTGIAIYFSLRFEPSHGDWFILAIISAVCGGMFVYVGGGIRIVLIALLLAMAGLAVAGYRAHTVAANVLEFRYYGPIEGRIVTIDRSASDAVRLTLDRVILRDVPPDRTPVRVRVSMHGTQGFITPEPGMTVILTGHLSPPGGAVEPGGYDFRRHAWFLQLGAVGYTRTPVLALSEHEAAGLGLWIERQRFAMSAAVREGMPGRAGGFAAAITTGDRSFMDQGTLDALRASNLAHLLAISGLHMGLLTGFVFAVLRLALAGVSLYVPSRKIAALGALAAGAVYLALSGGNVATERAYIMVSVMFVAVLVDRRAVTLRAVAVAAFIVLTLRPEALYGPGFQMSFAATTALVAVFGAMRLAPGTKGRWPKWARFMGGVALSSFVAGMATAPFAAAHFNQVPHYGLIANVVSVPLMGAIIIPGAVLAAVLSPFGLAWIGLGVMKPAILWILLVAETVAAWSGSLSFVVAPSALVLPLLAIGGLIIVIWQGWGRVLGVPVSALALVFWSVAERPSVLVSQSGGLVGVMTEDGRALSKPQGDGFAADVWLENDGDPVAQSDAHARGVFKTEGRMRWFSVGGAEVLHATGKVAAAKAVADCEAYALVVVNVDLTAPKGCAVYDLKRLRREGALSLEPDLDGLKIISSRDVRGQRLWSP
ncbi:ComEC family competence protein [Rhodobacteraceae bacterium]|nr:ComEC family competence protein [Paracoccaceae bacterium]